MAARFAKRTVRACSGCISFTALMKAVNEAGAFPSMASEAAASLSCDVSSSLLLRRSRPVKRPRRALSLFWRSALSAASDASSRPSSSFANVSFGFVTTGFMSLTFSSAAYVPTGS